MNNAQPQMATKNAIAANDSVAALLPEDRTMAMNMLIRLTGNLSHIADREAQALAQNDMMTFAILQDEKALTTQQYIQASEEFRANINLYRGTDSAMLDRLERLQNELGEKTRANNDIVHTIFERAQTRTHSSLLAAQEIGQDKRFTFEDAEKATNK